MSAPRRVLLRGKHQSPSRRAHHDGRCVPATSAPATSATPKRSAAAASSASLHKHAGCWDSTLQLQGDKCAHGNDQSITGSHAPKELPRRWLILSLWPSSWQAMRRRSGLPSLRGARIAVGACASIVFRVAAAENAPVPYEADSAVHSCLAIRISKEKRCAQRIYYLQRIA